MPAKHLVAASIAALFVLSAAGLGWLPSTHRDSGASTQSPPTRSVGLPTAGATSNSQVQPTPSATPSPTPSPSWVIESTKGSVAVRPEGARGAPQSITAPPTRPLYRGDRLFLPPGGSVGLHDGTNRWTESGPSEGPPRMVTVPAPKVPGNMIARLLTLTNESAAASTQAGAIVRSFDDRSPDGIHYPTRSGAFAGESFPPIVVPRKALTVPGLRIRVTGYGSAEELQSGGVRIAELPLRSTDGIERDLITPKQLADHTYFRVVLSDADQSYGSRVIWKLEAGIVDQLSLLERDYAGASEPPGISLAEAKAGLESLLRESVLPAFVAPTD